MAKMFISDCIRKYDEDCEGCSLNRDDIYCTGRLYKSRYKADKKIKGELQMDKDGIYITLLCISVVVIIFSIAIFMSSASCHAKANALGYSCNFGVFQGCVLEKPDGKKVLIEQLRDVDKD